MKLYLIILFALIGSAAFSQDNTMWLMNGKKVVIQKYSLTEDFDNRVVLYNNLKGKEKLKDAQDIFSITSKEGAEEVFYLKNIDAGNEFEVADMRNFLSGKTKIKQEYKSLWAGVGGLIAGFAGVAIPPAKVGENNATIPWAPIIPVGYVLIVGNTTKTFDQLKRKYPEMSTEEYYLMGAQKGIQEKRLRSSLIGTGLGILAGFITVRVANIY